jgi:hypothetical protein
MQFRLILGVLLLLPWHSVFAQSSAPEGWTITEEGGNAVYRPGNLPAGQSFVLTAKPFQNLQGQPFESWFAAQSQADLAERGTPAGAPQKSVARSEVLTQTQFFTDRAGKRWFVMYSASLAANGKAQFASMITDLPTSLAVPYVRAGATILGYNLKAANENNSTTPAIPSQPANHAIQAQNASPANRQNSATPNTDTNALRTAPDSGVPLSQIEAVLHEGRGVSTAMGFQYQESADLLLKDGWEYSSLDLPPEDLSVEAARRLHPERWHQWRRQGGDIYIQDQRTGQWSKLDAETARPLEQSLHVHLIHRGSYSFGGMGSYNTANGITFSADGRFERSNSVLAGSGTVQAAGGFSGGTSSYQDRNGRSASTVGTYSGGVGAAGAYSHSQSRTGDGTASGTYKISGYTLELDSANGQVQRFLAFYPFSNKPEIYLNGTTFNPSR